MSISASIALSSATAKQEQKVAVTLTVSNSGGSTVNVNSIQPLLNPNGLNSQPYAGALGIPQVGGAFPSAVTGGGSTTFSWNVVAHAPTNATLPEGSGSFAYSVGAIVLTNDGSITTATPATLTVTNIATN